MHVFNKYRGTNPRRDTTLDLLELAGFAAVTVAVLFACFGWNVA